jgi:hypothetical protein
MSQRETGRKDVRLAINRRREDTYEMHYGRSRFGSWELRQQFSVRVVDSKLMKRKSKDHDDDMKGAYSVIHKGEK